MASKSSGWGWIFPSILDIDSAKKAGRQGAVAASLGAVVTAVIAVASHQMGTEFFGMDLWALVDAGLFAVIAFGIYKMSRTAAILGFSLYLVERALMWMDYGPQNVFLALLFATMYFNGMRGTFEYHRFKNKTEADNSGETVADLAPE